MIGRPGEIRIEHRGVSRQAALLGAFHSLLVPRSSYSFLTNMPSSRPRLLFSSLLLATLLLGGCSSFGTFWTFLRGQVVVTEADVQRRLERRFPRDFKFRDDTLTLTLSNPKATLPPGENHLKLAFDMHLNVPGLRRQPQGHFALVSGLRYDPATYSLYLHEPILTTLDLPLGAQLQGEQLKAMGNDLLADFARNEPVYELSERRRNEIPLGRSIDAVDIENGRILIRVSR